MVYIDDIVNTGSDYVGTFFLKSFPHTRFCTKDLRQLKYILGIKVYGRKKGIFLSQRKYLLDLLAETVKLEAKHGNTPVVPNVHLIKMMVILVTIQIERCRRLVWKLNYLVVTHPNIAFLLSVVSQ